MRADLPLGRQLKKTSKLSLTTSTLSCNALDERIAALENEVESDEDSEYSEDSDSNTKEEFSNRVSSMTHAKKTISVSQNVIAETDDYGNVIRLKSSLSGGCSLWCLHSPKW